ncbi:hypothetical protein LCGC14_2751260 [marine sediment metagenome]|uniref:HNH nuclease domain-containing protein n=1 Tax=marine sediment metagenome TaxID=412755 RepID=A0A0F8Z1K8_9ZZZZ|nr:hypothetical protein [bacterium]
MTEKTCSKCKTLKQLDLFYKRVASIDGLRPECKICTKGQLKKYREANRDALKVKKKIYHANNSDKINDKKREYYAQNRDVMLERSRKWRKINREYAANYERERKKRDPMFKLVRNLRTRLYYAIKRNYKSGSAVRDLGCSISELKVYLESLFMSGMTWKNYGKWHIDHIKPLSFFDLADREQLIEVCHYSNLQPLWAIDNLRKGNKI